MRSITVLLVLISATAYCQGVTTKTTTKEIGKVGKLVFSLSKSVNIQDTSIILSITQTQSVLVNPDLRMVMIRKDEIDEVANVIKSFKEETGTKNPSEGITISHVTKDSVMLTCNYTKVLGWSIMIINIALQNPSTKPNTGYQVNYFVELKPKQIDDIEKMLTKALTAF